MTLFYSKVKDRKPLCKILVWGGIFQFGFNPPPLFSSAMWYWYYWVCSDLEPISEINVKQAMKKNVSEITFWFWFDAYHTLFSFRKAVLIFKFHLPVFTGYLHVTFFIIILFPILIPVNFMQSDYFPFIKSNLL